MTEALLPLWHLRARSARLATPLLKTADALFSQAALHSLDHPCVGECVLAEGEGRGMWIQGLEPPPWMLVRGPDEGGRGDDRILGATLFTAAQDEGKLVGSLSHASNAAAEGGAGCPASLQDVRACVRPSWLWFRLFLLQIRGDCSCRTAYCSAVAGMSALHAL